MSSFAQAWANGRLSAAIRSAMDRMETTAAGNGVGIVAGMGTV
ncbi:MULTISPECIES: hypothetical protein [unclassified Novosphingobium]|nr:MULTISPECIES: hypothetical protein [unclassified Novosphingobium]NKJ43797.1 hypothetical protein [Novosphingobium sp. SG720]NMN88558.1 hypothetical protein [Novosphingobium sp. SG916]